MLSYPVIRPLLFALSGETAHALTLGALDGVCGAGLARLLAPPRVDAPMRVMGLEFPNSVGLAAGLDKDGEHIDALGALGFGSIEIGTVTPRPQAGNPRPRLFRLPEAHALINRMGFNNKGVERLCERVKQATYRGVLGINIGKNKDTPVERAAEDYLFCLERVYALASYIAINLSSPNTPGLRDLQFGEPLHRLLGSLVETRERLAQQNGRYVPLALKIAPDMAEADLDHVADCVRSRRIDAVIATNTTLSREGVANLPNGNEGGGLSGEPLRERACAVMARLSGRLAGEVALIGVGGIMSGEDAADRVRAGAQLVQIYSGLIYRGPRLIAEAADAIARLPRDAAHAR